jgi:ClpP class serine protease
METVMTLHGFFEEHVISSRNGAASTREKWNQGKTFFAGEGIKLNLADEIMSFDTRVAKLIQSGNNRVVISENNSLSFEEAIMKFKFTEEQKAKLASGVPLEKLGLS